LERLEARFRRLRRRSRGWLWAAAAAVAIAAGLGLWASRRRPTTTDEPLVREVAGDPDEKADRLRDEMARLEAEVKLRMTVVRHMLALEAALDRRDELRRVRARLDAAERIAREIDEAAGVIVYDADRTGRQEGGRESAIAAYRDVIRLFPRTRWAELARKRLNEIGKS
jgi:hypothetical protein